LLGFGAPASAIFAAAEAETDGAALGAAADAEGISGGGAEDSAGAALDAIGAALDAVGEGVAAGAPVVLEELGELLLPQATISSAAAASEVGRRESTGSTYLRGPVPSRASTPSPADGSCYPSRHRDQRSTAR
jgi:hypothetical protein